jgi:hypothetical protein
VSNVQLGYGNGVDLVGSFWYSTLDSLLVIVGKNRGHDGKVPDRQLDRRYVLCRMCRSRAPVI